MKHASPIRIVVAACLLAAGPAHAQVPRNGPKLGFGIATQTAGQFLAWSGLPKPGPIAGWSFEAPLTNQTSLLIEPMYIGKGSVTVNSVYKTRYSIALNYLEIPLLLKVSTNPDPQGLYLSGGLMYGYLLNTKYKEYDHGTLVTNTSYALTNTTNRGQWSAAVGLGQEFGNWLVEIRGQSSLNTFDRLVRSHNVVYSVQLAWRFPGQAKRHAGHGGDDD